MPNDKWNESYFNDEFGDEDPWDFESSTYEQEKYRRQNRVIADQVGHPDRILELGCAEGVHSEMLLKDFPESLLHGVDISSTAIDRASERVDDTSSTFEAATAQEALNNLDEPVDVVVASEMIYYLGDMKSVPEMHSFITHLSDILRPGGLLCMANIVDQGAGPEAHLTAEPVLRSYQALLCGEFSQVHDAKYSEHKSEDDETHTYEIWAFKP